MAEQQCFEKPPKSDAVGVHHWETLMYKDTNGSSVSDAQRFSDFLGTRESPIIIEEPQLGTRDRQARAQLRSIPFFLEFGLSQFMYDDLWRKPFQLVAHDHLDPATKSATDIAFPLVHLVTSKQLMGRDAQEHGQEDISQAAVTWELLSTATWNDEQYILVCDTTAPHIPSESPVAGRSVADHFSAERFEYPQLVREYVRDHVDTGLPLNKTRNLFFHKVSAHHRAQGLDGRSLRGLFDYEAAPASSPIWDPLYYFIEHEREELREEYEQHITESLRSWVEWGDTGAIARRMIAVLHRCDFDAEQLENYQYSDNR